MTTTRLEMLIDALGSGADVFSATSNAGDSDDINEIAVVLGDSSTP